MAVLSTIQARHASHATSGRANKAKDGPGKRLGAKKTAGEKVVTGMIIYRQRGTVWYAGENAGMGRDHTIFAMAPGFVRYYKDPLHPSRQFIGVALLESQVLPRPLNAARVRRLGRIEVPLERQRETVPFGTPLKKSDSEAKDGFYVYRPPNWKIGRTMPKVEVKNNNPFARWQKKGKRNAAYKRRKGIA
ncbi:ribosomal L27 protein-domain-containing protein [Tricharina praecox]|uniref:ribosomal L27 protein-domain-containing protein n=1 Tax=Tricharina praecox TaxID=43433 RepID=UPI00221FE91C|nr:ribosomal L27 protein-domain-containing protein [Tricharina praecox]KAI5854403.1 ribosomal L27 protein-domain-containing protein [Tricharina praecox]